MPYPLRFGDARGPVIRRLERVAGTTPAQGAMLFNVELPSPMVIIFAGLSAYLDEAWNCTLSGGKPTFPTANYRKRLFDLHNRYRSGSITPVSQRLVSLPHWPGA